jgi:solute:Na+ symporter, SSS family
MTPGLILISFLIYTALIFGIAWITSRNADNLSFFIGNKKSPWPVVAFGMIGASLSGVTFISIPGWVGETGFTYFAIVLGYVAGYAVITTVLLPLYYKLNLTSIYSYLESRFGGSTYKTGASFFLLSRIIGASFRMFLVVGVLQVFVFDHFGIPFWITVVLFMILIQLYTMKGGIKTIVWTDTLQTTFMLLAVVISIGMILSRLEVGLGEMVRRVWDSDISRVIITDVNNPRYFLKMFLSGMFITIVMTGLDQDMMQKNLSCKSLPDAQKNMTTLSLVLVPVNLIFLFLGAVLLIYVAQFNLNLPEATDHVFPFIAFESLGIFAGIVFIIGLISAAYSSADSALTALTTSFSIDILELQKKYGDSEKLLKKHRQRVHIAMSLIVIFVIIIFEVINDQAIIHQLFTFAGYTYGPLLGFYSFGLFTKYKVYDRLVPVVAVASPVLSYGTKLLLEQGIENYKVGFELLLINGFITILGLFILRMRN